MTERIHRHSDDQDKSIAAITKLLHELHENQQSNRETLISEITKINQKVDLIKVSINGDEELGLEGSNQRIEKLEEITIKLAEQNNKINAFHKFLAAVYLLVTIGIGVALKWLWDYYSKKALQ